MRPFILAISVAIFLSGCAHGPRGFKHCEPKPKRGDGGLFIGGYDYLCDGEIVESGPDGLPSR